jgi:hypothetical protein
MLKKLLIILTAFVLVMAAGCAPGATKSTTSETMVCQNLVLLKTSVDSFKNTSFTDNNAMQASLSVIRTNLNNVVQTAANLANVKLDNVQNATNDLANALGALPPDTAPQDALNSVQPQLKALGIALDQLNSDLDCTNLLKLQNP